MSASIDRVAAPPVVVVLAGPNGAGKSTAAPALLQGTLGVTEFVNADDIARGLSAFNPEGAAIAAGRVMLVRLRELAEQRVSFAFETTLASRSFAPRLRELKQQGYTVHIFFLWIRSADLVIERVADRVKMGGHNIPTETIRRRHEAGLRNFFSLYEPIASSWTVFNASDTQLTPVAEHLEQSGLKIYDNGTWSMIKERGQR